MHPLLGLLMLAGVGAFLVFAFRQGMGVRRDDRRDGGYPGGTSDLGPSHHSGDGGFGHG
jgi:hypothetical protein